MSVFAAFAGVLRRWGGGGGAVWSNAATNWFDLSSWRFVEMGKDIDKLTMKEYNMSKDTLRKVEV